MITLLTGENSFEIDRSVQAIISDFKGQPETYDGVELGTNDLPNIVMGATLFANERLVIIKSLSDNKQIWDALIDWLPRLSDDVHVALVDPKPDKRTKTYKELTKVASVKEHKLWGDRDTSLAQQWVIEEAQKQGMKLAQNSARLLVDRVGINQWELWHALQKLVVLDEISPQTISEVIDAHPRENVFNLFEAALRGDAQRVSAMLQTLELTEDPYMVFGLLGGQAFQLVALMNAEKPTSEVAKDIGAHPFALGKLEPYAKKRKADGKQIITIFADADSAMKTSGGEPWLLIERALIKVASL